MGETKVILILLDIWLFLLIGSIILRMIYRKFSKKSWMRRHLIKSSLSPFFAIRDNLVMLVAKGEVNEDEEVFQYYYKFVNNMLRNLYSLQNISLMDLFRIPKLMEENEEDLDKHFRMISLSKEHPSTEFRETIRNFHNQLYMFIIKNNMIKFSVKFAISLGKQIPWFLLKPLLNWIRRKNHGSRNLVYQFFRFIKREQAIAHPL